MSKRTKTHVIETKAQDTVQKKVNSFYENGDALFRKLSERDYGIDAVIELFEEGCPTGEFALIQIKGTEKTIVPLKTKPVVSCSISSSNALYAYQKKIPVYLIYLSISKPHAFYYQCLQYKIGERDRIKIEDQDSITVQIPIENNAYEDLGLLFQSIKRFYSYR